MKRVICLTLCIALLCALLALPAGASGGNVCFLAVNDTIPGALDDSTMPFFSGGQLYIPYTIFYTAALGVTPAYDAASQTLLLSGAGVVATFGLLDGSVSVSNGTSAASALLQGGVPFVPANDCGQLFGFSVSFLTSKNRYAVVRLTTGAEVYSDALFIEKADTLIETRMAQYLQAKQAAQPAQDDADASEDPGPSESPTQEQTQTAQPEEEDEPEEEEEEPAEPVQLLPAIVDASLMRTAQELLAEYEIEGVYFFTADEIVQYSDLVLSLYTAGVRVGVRATGEDVSAELQAANDRLYQLLHVRTLLALIPEQAAAPVGYLSLRAQTFSAETAEAYAGQTVVLCCTGTELESMLAQLTEAEIPFTVGQLLEAQFTGV